MNQNDFRALLSAKTSAGNGPSSTSSASGGNGSFGGKRNMTASDLDEIRRLSKKPKKKQGKKSGKSATTGDDNGDSSNAAKSAYRDRAAERRQGIHSDMIDADEYAHFDAEQTKFLGGDLEHTHLVKGLDFALLSQLKREKEKLLHATAAHKQQQSQPPNTRSSGSQSTAAAADKLTFKSRVGRLVYFHAVQSSAASSLLASRTTEQFLPGRMFYTFRLSANELASVPVIVQRSKEDCPEPDDVVSGMVSELVISNVSDALSRTRHGGGGSKRLRKKSKAVSGSSAGAATGGKDDSNDNEDPAAGGSPANAQAVAVAGESDDEDIFPDAGEYVPIHARDEDDTQDTPRKRESPSSSSSGQQTGYFSNLSASLSAAELAEKQREEAAEHAWKQTIRKVVATQSRVEREQQARDAERSKAPVDEYSECYPEYQAAASALDSEDDEETPRKGKADRDRDNDDGDAGETEKTRRRKQKQGNKLQSDLEKINKLMDAKKTSASERA